MHAICKYPGSKWSIANWIISFFPEHHSYLEPFAGSMAVLFNKPRSNIETVNDLDGNVVNLFEWIKKDPERLAHEIYWTPYARQVYEDAFAAVPEDSLGTMFITETAAGMCLYDTLEEFAEHWKEWEPGGSFCIPRDKVDVIRVIQEEVTAIAERDIEKDLIEIERAIKEHVKRNNSFTVAVLQRCHTLILELSRYKAIGTVKEFLEIAEKQKPKKVKKIKVDKNTIYETCANCCATTVLYNGMQPNHCPNCGQAIDWRGK